MFRYETFSLIVWLEIGQQFGLCTVYTKYMTAPMFSRHKMQQVVVLFKPLRTMWLDNDVINIKKNIKNDAPTAGEWRRRYTLTVNCMYLLLSHWNWNTSLINCWSTKNDRWSLAHTANVLADKGTITIRLHLKWSLVQIFISHSRRVQHTTHTHEIQVYS